MSDQDIAGHMVGAVLDVEMFEEVLDSEPLVSQVFDTIGSLETPKGLRSVAFRRGFKT